MKKIYLFFLLNPYLLLAQNNITGTIQSVPSRTAPDSARITLTNIVNQVKYTKLLLKQGTLDHLDITGLEDIPNGTYQRNITASGGHYLNSDTITITENMVMDEKVIKDKDLTSSIYLNANKSLLFLTKVLTSTYSGSPGGSILHRSRNPPLKLDARNYDPLDPLSMPEGIRPFLDEALQDAIIKTDGIVSFSESMPGDTRVQFVFPTTSGMPYPFFAYTDYNYDLTTCYFNRDLMTSQPDNRKRTAFAKELLIRFLNIQTNSGDINMLSYYGGTTATSLHPDEAEVIKIVYTLPNNTDMKKYRDTIIVHIENTPPQQFNIVSPAENAQLDPKIEQQVKWRTAKDDGVVTYELSVLNTAGNATYTTADTTYNMPANTLNAGNSQITIKAIDDHNATTNSSNIVNVTTITGIEEVLSTELKYYPNLVSGYVNLVADFRQSVSLKVQIYSVEGILLANFQNNISAGHYSQRIDMSNFKSGMYILKTTINNYTLIDKVVKK